VQLSFSAFSTESCCDRVQVYDGTTTSATRIGNFSGSTLPTSVTSTGNALLVTFTSDFSVTGAGFTANWTSLTTTTQCSGTTTLTDNSGTFSDGSGTNNYAHDLDCRWLIQPNDGGLVQLSFSSFDTEFRYDEVRVYDGTTTSAALLGTYSGSTLPASVTSTGNAMLVRFTSDATIARGGFSASWASIPTSCRGHVVLQNTQGTISDGPGNYRAFDNCSWHIATPGATGIQLTFTQFNTEEKYDFVQVYDGANATAPLLASYTGNLSTPFTVTANSGQMYVQFTSDLSVQAAGFTATYLAQGVAASRGGTVPAVPYKLYPNPATDHMVLELDGPATLTLVNTLGQPVGTYAHRQLSRLEVGHLPAGVYSLRVQLPGHAPFAIKCTLQ
jgi:cubilin